MFGSRRNRIRQDIVRKVAPMFHFEALERMGGVLDNGFYTDPYVLGFYGIVVHTLAMVALGANPLQPDYVYDRNLGTLIECDVAQDVFGSRYKEVLSVLGKLGNNGNFTDADFIRGQQNGIKFVYLMLGMVPRERDEDIEEAKKQVASGELKSLGTQTVPGQLLYNLYVSYVTDKYLIYRK